MPPATGRTTLLCAPAADPALPP